MVYLPLRNVNIGGISTAAWYQINPQTGETIGITEDGGHQALAEYAATYALASFLLTAVLVGPTELALQEFPQIKQNIKDFDTQSGTISLDIGARRSRLDYRV